MTLAQPDIEPHPTKEGIFVLKSDFSTEWKAEGLKQQLNAEAGFEFDLASVPWLARAITGFTPSSFKWIGPLFHDLIYEYEGDLPQGSYRVWDNDIDGWVNSKKIWTRKNADRFFCRLMKDDGVGSKRRKMAYWAVRAGGWLAWKT